MILSIFHIGHFLIRRKLCYLLSFECPREITILSPNYLTPSNPQMKCGILVYIFLISTSSSMTITLLWTRSRCDSGARTTSQTFLVCFGQLHCPCITFSGQVFHKCKFNQPKQKSRLLDDKLHPERIVLFGSNSSFRNNASLSSLARESKQFEKEIGTNKFLNF